MTHEEFGEEVHRQSYSDGPRQGMNSLEFDPDTGTFRIVAENHAANGNVRIQPSTDGFAA